MNYILWIFIALVMGIVAETERHWILIRSKTEPIDISKAGDLHKNESKHYDAP